MFEFKKKTGMSTMWNLAAQTQVCVSTDLRGYFVIDTLYYMHARARARARAAGKACFLAPSYSRCSTMAVLWRPVSMVPMPAKTPHLFCAVDSMTKHFLDVIGRNFGQ